MPEMAAFAMVAWGQPPSLVRRAVPEPGPRDALIRVGGSGACGSDLKLIHQYRQNSAPWPAGFILGHENAGWVVEVGPEVQHLEPGDPVAVMGAWGCGRCRRCVDGHDQYCESVAAPAARGGGLGADGGMAEFMLVPDADRHLVALPEGLSPEQAAPLTDAALTSYHAVKRSRRKLADDAATALVLGVGGVGRFVVQILAKTTSATIFCVDPRAEARLDGREHGAAHAFGPEDDVVERVRELTEGRGVDVVLDCVGSPHTTRVGAQVIRSLGDLTIVGSGGGVVRVGFSQLPYAVSVQTTLWGGYTDLVEVLALAADGHLTCDITRYGLHEAESAYEDLRMGRIRGRAVVVPGPEEA